MQMLTNSCTRYFQSWIPAHNNGQVRFLVTRRAFVADGAAAGGAAHDELIVRRFLVVLIRRVSRDMAVLAARMLQHRAHGVERRERARFGYGRCGLRMREE